MKVICVPRSVDAARRLDLDECWGDDLEEQTLSEDSFDRLWRTGVFERLNKVLGVLIDDFEDERIVGAENLSHGAEVVRELLTTDESDEASRLSELFELALARGTGVYFFF